MHKLIAAEASFGTNTEKGTISNRINEGNRQLCLHSYCRKWYHWQTNQIKLSINCQQTHNKKLLTNKSKNERAAKTSKPIWMYIRKEATVWQMKLCKCHNRCICTRCAKDGQEQARRKNTMGGHVNHKDWDVWWNEPAELYWLLTSALKMNHIYYVFTNPKLIHWATWHYSFSLLTYIWSIITVIIDAT